MGCFTICEPEVNVLEFVPGGLRGKASEENCAAFIRQAMRSLDEGDADMALWEQLDVQSPLYNYARQGRALLCETIYPALMTTGGSGTFPKAWMHFS
jgi:hypothetical protein